MMTSIAPIMAMATTAQSSMFKKRNLGHPYDNYYNNPTQNPGIDEIRAGACGVVKPDVTDISHAVTTEKANMLLDKLYKIVEKQGYGISHMKVVHEQQAVEFSVSNKKTWHFGKFKELENSKAPNGQSYGPFIYCITYFPENFMNGGDDEHDYYRFFFKNIVENKKTVGAELVGFNIVYEDNKAFKLRKYYDTFITHTRVDLNKLIKFCEVAGEPEEVIDKDNGIRTNCSIFNKIINLLKDGNKN